ncbi:MAG: ABC transporter permease [Anaerolineales bacterium]|nr:ABC transporter permease [Anaerolineales bacterium]
MHNAWLIAKHAYRNTVVKRSFIIGTLAVPFFMAAIIGIAVLVFVLSENNKPIGYVDNSGLLKIDLQTNLPDSEDRIEILSYPDEATAIEALNSEEIQAFWVLPPDYQQTLRTDLYYLEEPPDNDIWREFDDFIRINLIDALPKSTHNLLLEGPDITVIDITNNRDFSQNSIFNYVLPIFACFFFVFASMNAANYMLGVVVDEKENRTMEIMITSVSSKQLISGKTGGLIAAALTQLVIYVLVIILGILIARPYIELLHTAKVPWTYLGVMLLFFFPAYALLSAVMVAVGGVITELQQGQQISGILNMFFMFPLFMLPLLITNPTQPAFIFMTLFPTTAFMTISLRWGLGTIPIWQLGLSWVILVSTTIFVVWVATRVFRTGMLRYGQTLSIKSVLATIKGY